MTFLMEEAIKSLRQDVPAERQDEVARLIMQLTGRGSATYILTPDEVAELDVSEAAASRGDFASDDEIGAIWAKHGL